MIPFVMNAWAKQQNIKNVKVIPDGSQTLHVLWVCWLVKTYLGFGMRSWRYMAIVKDGVIENGGKNLNLTTTVKMMILY